MKDKIKEMYADVKMPSHCEAAIRQAMAGERRRSTLRPVPALAAMAVVVLVIFLGSNSAIRAAALETVEQVGKTIGFWERAPWSGSLLEYEEMMEDRVPSGSRHDRVVVEDDRVYLCTLDVRIDITDEISMETPYIHTYVDLNMERILIVGGTPENLGLYSFSRDAETGKWLSGSGRNHCDREGNAYPWVEAAWEALDIPWPL